MKIEEKSDKNQFKHSHVILDKTFRPMFDIRVDYWWHWYQYLKSEVLWHINQLIRRKLRLLWFVRTQKCKQKQQIKECYRIEHAGHKAKSGQPVRQYSTSGTLFLFFVPQTCQNIARTIEISSISLVHWMHGWAIQQNNRMVHQIWSDKNNWKTASVFQIMCKCCVLIS